jgi:DNA-binding MarR family transcriptional regulator
MRDSNTQPEWTAAQHAAAPCHPDEDRRSPNALDLETYIPAYLTFLANKLSSCASAIYRRRFGVGIVDWRIMALLAIEPWIAAGRICEVIGLDRAAVSRSVRFMIKQRVVESRFRNGNERRQFLALTRKGLDLHDRIVEVARVREQQLLAGFSDEERATAVRLLARMHAQLPNVRM